MLDFIGTVILTAVMVVNINAVLSSLSVSRGQRLVAAAAVGLWIGFAAASAAAGVMAVSRPFPVIGVYVLFPIVAMATLVLLSPTWRTALLELPTPLLVGLNVSRLFGALFLALVAADRLSGPFPFSAAWGDITTGLLAGPALWLALRERQSQSLLMAWNAFGTLDLVSAVALGVMSVQGSPTQVFTTGPGSTAMQALPWAFTPTVLVPFYLVVHGILFAQLWQKMRFNGRGRLVARAA